MNIEQALEELGESDVGLGLAQLNDHIECAETSETTEDVLANLDEAIAEALKLVGTLRALKETIHGR